MYTRFASLIRGRGRLTTNDYMTLDRYSDSKAMSFTSCDQRRLTPPEEVIRLTFVAAVLSRPLRLPCALYFGSCRLELTEGMLQCS
jgi:hypothetical protein